jgi:molybdopterin synthase catalytic subunit
MNATESLVAIRERALSLDEVVRNVSWPGAGAIVTFVGVVRDNNEGRTVTRLDYSSYTAMAIREMAKIALEIEQEIGDSRVSAIHRVGQLAVGDTAVVCAASAPHRGDAFRACHELIDRIKARVPIWKREWGPEGPAWVGWVDARCAPGHDHSHSHE